MDNQQMLFYILHNCITINNNYKFIYYVLGILYFIYKQAYEMF